MILYTKILRIFERKNNKVASFISDRSKMEKENQKKGTVFNRIKNRVLLILIIFIVGVLVGYYIGYDIGFEKAARILTK